MSAWNLTLPTEVSYSSNKGLAMPDRKEDPKSKGNTRGVRVFVGVGLAIGIGLIIAGGWFMKNDNPDTSTTAHLRTTPKAPSTTTGSR